MAALTLKKALADSKKADAIVIFMNVAKFRSQEWIFLILIRFSFFTILSKFFEHESGDNQSFLIQSKQNILANLLRLGR